MSLGIVNYAWKLERGLQVGLVNIIRDNPKGLKVLPVFDRSLLSKGFGLGSRIWPVIDSAPR